MRLTRINLAGFKSFVDPTHIPVPGQLVGIVGPNGCGKSNVIDAVRWVLGETSAKHLRGETMQDVLFNGSGQRKPVNRASVELIFDNSLGKAAGQWSQYAEISVKRVLERDGDSAYYVNNTHVRRRDVTDIFLGTGLGARAYAIIEQGMISRVIEAKPEELRVFLEEAAGVSKYRERRRETESRLKDTRENLLRVDDIRQELGKQLEHLQGQAEVARQYHALQARLATTQGLMWMTRRQEAAAARARATREIERLAVELEAEAARLREAEKRLEALREEHFRAGDTVHAAQGALYEANAEVARLELELAHLREKRERIEHQIGSLRAQLGEAAVQLEGARQDLDEWRTQSTEAALRLAALDKALEAERAKLPVAEEAYRTTRTRREELQDALARAEQARHVEVTKLDHAARVLDQLAQRTERLREERAAMPPSDEAELERLREAVRELEALLQAQRGALAEAERSLSSEEQVLKARTETLDAAGQHETALAARLQALRQLQDRISRAAGVDDWLEHRGLGAAPRLWQGISIEAGWEDALEAVLRERLSGVAVSGAGDAARWLADAPPGKLTLVDTTDAATATEPAVIDGAEPLRHYVTCRDARLSAVMDEWLHQVHVVPDASAGLARRSALPAGAVMVTREGHIYTRHSVSFHAPDSELHGVLSRQREIEALEVELAGAQQATAEADAGVSLAVAAIEQHKAGIARLREDLAGTQQRCHEIQVESVRRSEQAQRRSQRAEQIAAELAEIAEHMQGEVARREDAGARLAEYERTCEQARAEVELAAELYARADSVLKLQREAVQQAQHTQQEATFQSRAAQAKIAEVENAIRLVTGQQKALADSLAAEEQVLAGCDEAPWQAQLGAALELKGERERTLAGARDALEEMETRLKSIEQERLTAEQRMAPLRERANEIRLKEQEARLTEDQYTQQLAEAGADEAALAALMEKGLRSSALQGEIARLTEEIRALGAVNLAALEELQSAEARKTYLDMQWQDLTEAMNTLEDAIRRIDRETRERLCTTFEEVNQHFGRMFPALFGGGTAKLVLSGEEILDSGVQVTAQPPGKKNTSIHLLSGGEKALTALALVFALFQLNPAPFCLLDEVDAPLDDYNTQRFCDLVRRMAEHSQFLFISHNKITMEIASQLLGITMQEPGVSRVVAVDIEEAMKLTEEAA